MKTKFKKQDCSFGCYTIEEINTYLPVNDFTIFDVLKAKIDTRDKIWFIQHNCAMEIEEIEGLKKEIARKTKIIKVPVGYQIIEDAKTKLFSTLYDSVDGAIYSDAYRPKGAESLIEEIETILTKYFRNSRLF